jgi:hypothetical protein
MKEPRKATAPESEQIDQLCRDLEQRLREAKVSPEMAMTVLLNLIAAITVTYGFINTAHQNLDAAINHYTGGEPIGTA